MRVLPVALVLCTVLVLLFVGLQRQISLARVTPVRLAAADLPQTDGDAPRVRRPTVAGAFYPRSAAVLGEVVDKALEKAGDVNVSGELIGIISPHAGYEYSGGVAAFAYAPLRGRKYDTVVVVGPSHRAAFDGAALPEADLWETPLGRVPVDRALANELAAADSRFFRDDSVMAAEHSLEVQVPFLQRTLGEFRLLPIQVHDASLENCAALSRALAKVLGGKSALLVASTDLSHYPAYAEARKTDQKTLDLIEAWRLRDLWDWEAAAPTQGVPELYCALCGLGPVLVVMDASRRLGANVSQVLRYANSGDVPGGDRRRCVGYGAVALCRVADKPASPGQALEEPAAEKGEPQKVTSAEEELNPEQQKYVLELARTAIREWVANRRAVEPDRREGILGEKRATFVTIKKGGRLRGCIGGLEPRQPLVDDVVDHAIAAATHDPRFPPVQVHELPELKLHISVLSPVRPISDPSEIIVGRHGVIVSQGIHRGVFLPEVATEQGWDRETMLTILCTEKAGLPPDAWRTGARLSVFTTQSFGDEE